MSKIAFANKSQSGAYDAGLFNAQDANEIKNSVNALYDLQPGTLEFPEFTVSHVNGVQDNFAGIKNPLVSGGTAAGSDGSNHLLLTPISPNWKTLPFSAKAVTMTVLTNVIPADLTAGNPINVSLAQAYMYQANNSSLANLKTVQIDSFGTNMSVSPNGPLNNPLEVGDTATLFRTVTGTLADIGLANGTVSNFYFTFNIFISASAATKDYKFKIYLTYQ